ncbi:unnamed protein product [Periconia digitata]|uniref:Uncharacterized protein n=1 Tax=Periconia digitata TaxID=1303443 RepID=A0A9W4UT31_9PLEO|nr:unnamed protein product [Periconia digitata]
MHFSTLFTFGLATYIAAASPTNLQRRKKIGHDEVVGFQEKVPSSVEGYLMMKYKPYLKVYNGCVPFPAVNAAGDYSGGVKPTGHSSGGCSGNKGQVYARSGSGKDGAWGIMYSWYFPKDSPSSGAGHRHDWEEIVVWLESKSTSAKVRGVAFSGHGDYEKHKDPPFKGSRPQVGYNSQWPINHTLMETSEVGGEQPLVAWDSMTEAARYALSNEDFGAASVKFIDRDGTFKKKLEESFI